MSLPLGGSQRFSDVIFGQPQLKICYVVILFSHIASPSKNINIGSHKILSALVQGPVKVREYHTKGLKGFKHINLIQKTIIQCKQLLNIVSLYCQQDVLMFRQNKTIF